MRNYLIPAILIVMLISIVTNTFSQKEDLQVNVFSDNKSLYKYPWAGGLNSCQFGMIDIDLNGVKDLVVFDRMGNRLLTFLNDNIPGTVSFTFAPEYASSFPEIHDWLILVDYNLDGKEDIFTYSPGYAAMMVYKNISTSKLEFRREIYPYLTSFQGGGYTNILVTYADYPAIVDLDGDGDLDILTFWGLGSFVEMHKNLSMEKYGNADSLDYIKTEYCWGHFAESIESNVIALDSCIGQKRGWEGESVGEIDDSRDIERHTGSTFLVLDLNNDGLPDVVLGDVSYPNLIALTNGGTIETAFMVSQDMNFPTGTRNVWLYSMPAAAYPDIDNDGIKDLLVSPFDPNPYSSANFKSVWYYQNTGINSQPVFIFNRDAFLQENMIDVGSGAYPVLQDYDGNGLLDLFIGNYGYYDTSYFDQYLTLHSEYTGKICLFRNIGTQANPSFDMITRDFAGVSGLGRKGIVPTFGDLDGDGDLDMLVGSELGTLYYYKNGASPGQPMDMTLAASFYQGIDVGDYSAPQLFDLDQDGILDLVIGEKKGNLNYYHNNGTHQAPNFVLVTDSLGKVNVVDYSVSLDGYSVPMFFRSSGKTGLLVGSEQGKIFYFTGIDNNLQGKFHESDSLGYLINETTFNSNRGLRTAGFLSDINSDGNPELIAGNFSGGLEYFPTANKPPVNSGISSINWFNSVKIYPVPVKDLLNVEFTLPKNCDGGQIEIFNYEGKTVAGHNISGNDSQIELDLRELPPALYFISITIQGIATQRYVRKIVKL